MYYSLNLGGNVQVGGGGGGVPRAPCPIPVQKRRKNIEVSLFIIKNLSLADLMDHLSEYNV